MRGIERCEQYGDWYEELAEELERTEAHKNAPQGEPLTDEELEEWSRKFENNES